MTVSDWIDGVRSGDHDPVYEAWLGIVRRVARLRHEPDYIWEDWDVLVVLDACRYDQLVALADEFDFLDTVDSRVSAATSTTIWSRRNFADRFATELAATTYLTANPNSITIGDTTFPERCDCGHAVGPDHRALVWNCPACDARVAGERHHPFDKLVELWRERWDAELGTLLPGYVTARAVELARNRETERLIVHYNQPHHPFLTRRGGQWSRPLDVNDDYLNVWEALRDGGIGETAVWEAYQENLRLVLADVAVLLSNVDATVAITSDHGNALGEWGVYGHPNPPVPIESLVRVPWVEAAAENTAEQSPDEIEADCVYGHDRDETETTVDQRLRDLGYR